MTEPSITLPLSLRHAIELGECVLFLGAGIGNHLYREDGKNLPDASGLARDLAENFSIDTDSDDLSKVSELLQIRGKREALEDYIRKQFSDLTPDDSILWLCSRKWRAIFTTNYDNGIERGYELVPDPPQNPITIRTTSDLVPVDSRFEIPIYHIHGTVFGEINNIVISQSDYTKFRSSRRMLFEILKEKFATSTILYIGYSNKDPNWALILTEITEEFQPSKLPTAYRVGPDTEKDDAEILKSRGIEIIDGNLELFVAAATVQLEPFNADDGRLQALEKTIPSYFADAFTRNPAPVARLVASWQYVNQANFSGTPNTKRFFHGDIPNWSLIGSGISFQRDIENELYEKALDYITSNEQKPITFVVLGPAGYGITTLLMNLAVRLVNERVGPVYFLKSGANLIEGDMDFAITLAGAEFVCFIIDHASENSDQLQSIISRLRDTKKPAIIICGSRMNEWRQRNVRLHFKELDLDPLSNTEIEKLLDCLKINHELNQLEHLSRDLQRAVIQEKYGKELLVVMRESTEDKRFDAILEDEYFGIQDELCKRIYLTVCCFHQYGNFVRNELLINLVDLNITDFYEAIKDSLDGVLIDECIDEANGLYAFRTRHRLIAKIVWDRCGEKSLKNEIIQKSIERLNLLHRQDFIIFEKFIRNDDLVDGIQGLEGKIRFFEMACKKDPNNSYVRQHYARMLYREGKIELALSKIEHGIALNPQSTPRVLTHTKGVILGAQALQAANVDIGRRRLVQAEDVFRSAMSQSSRDHYSYQSLAKLYLDWSKQCNSVEECATYLTKAEETISQGLSNCRDKEALWIVSAEIEEWLGNQPAQLKALEAAVEESPGSIFARYMLGKHFRKIKLFKEALEVLEPNIKNHPDEFRSFIEYALALRESGKSLSEAIAVLEIASGPGLNDVRYVAHLGGLIFLNGEFGKAARIFSDTKGRDFTQSDLQKVVFFPKNAESGDNLTFFGKVISRQPRYSLIESEGYPPFFCHSSKYRDLSLKDGMKLKFKIGFSPKGATAIEPQIIE